MVSTMEVLQILGVRAFVPGSAAFAVMRVQAEHGAPGTFTVVPVTIVSIQVEINAAGPPAVLILADTETAARVLLTPTEVFDRQDDALAAAAGANREAQ